MGKFSWLSDIGLHILVDHLHDGLFVIDDGVLVYANRALADMFGYPADRLIGRPFLDLIAPQDRALVIERYNSRLSGSIVPEQYKAHITNAQGALICCSLNVTLIDSPDGHKVTIGTARDVTQQEKEIKELEASKVALQSIFDQLPDVFYRTDMKGIITMITPACFEAIGYLQEEMLGTHMADYYSTPEDRQNILQAITEGGGRATQVEAALKHKNGSTIWVSTNAFIRFGKDGQPYCIEGVARDISARKHMEEQLRTLSRTDSLTGVCNRHFFMSQAEEVIKLMRRYQRPASMMLADLDHFKKINDQYGHQAGDEALKAFVKVCRDMVRESDIIGRLGGEEFAITLPETSIDNAQNLAERIRKATDALEIHLPNQTIKLTVSIGLVTLLPGDFNLQSLLHRADLAMYQAKEKGRNRVITVLESD